MLLLLIELIGGKARWLSEEAALESSNAGARLQSRMHDSDIIKILSQGSFKVSGRLIL